MANILGMLGQGLKKGAKNFASKAINNFTDSNTDLSKASLDQQTPVKGADTSNNNISNSQSNGSSISSGGVSDVGSQGEAILKEIVEVKKDLQRVDSKVISVDRDVSIVTTESRAIKQSLDINEIHFNRFGDKIENLKDFISGKIDQISEAGEGGGMKDMLIDTISGGKTKGGGALSATKNLGKSILKSPGKTGALAAGMSLAVGAYNYVTAEDDKGRKEAAGEGAGGAVGALAGAKGGAALGATIGSIIPGAGTIVGGAIGGFLGATVGALAGSKVGSMISGFFSEIDDTIPDTVKENPAALLKTVRETLPQQIMEDKSLSESDKKSKIEELNEYRKEYIDDDMEEHIITRLEKMYKYYNSYDDFKAHIKDYFYDIVALGDPDANKKVETIIASEASDHYNKKEKDVLASYKKSISEYTSNIEENNDIITTTPEVSVKSTTQELIPDDTTLITSTDTEQAKKSIQKDKIAQEASKVPVAKSSKSFFSMDKSTLAAIPVLGFASLSASAIMNTMSRLGKKETNDKDVSQTGNKEEPKGFFSSLFSKAMGALGKQTEVDKNNRQSSEMIKNKIRQLQTVADKALDDGDTEKYKLARQMISELLTMVPKDEKKDALFTMSTGVGGNRIDVTESQNERMQAIQSKLSNTEYGSEKYDKLLNEQEELRMEIVQEQQSEKDKEQNGKNDRLLSKVKGIFSSAMEKDDTNAIEIQRIKSQIESYEGLAKKAHKAGDTTNYRNFMGATNEYRGKLPEGTMSSDNKRDISKSTFKASGDFLADMASHIHKSETGKAVGDYGAAKDIGDGAGISFGSYQLTEKSGGIKKFISQMAKDGDKEAEELLKGFGNGQWFKGDKSQLETYLKKVGTTEAGKKTQDELYSKNYMAPALKLAEQNGITDKAAIAQIIDHTINAGLGGASRMLRMSKGKTAQDIAEARKSDYQRLASKDKSKAKYLKGWLARVDNNTKAFATYAGTDITDTKVARPTETSTEEIKVARPTETSTEEIKVASSKVNNSKPMVHNDTMIALKKEESLSEIAVDNSNNKIAEVGASVTNLQGAVSEVAKYSMGNTINVGNSSDKSTGQEFFDKKTIAEASLSDLATYNLASGTAIRG